MKSTRIFFIAAVIVLTTSAYQNSTPSLSPNATPNINLTAVLKNTAPLQPLSVDYSFISPTPSPTSCNNSAYVKDVTIADGTQVTPGSTFTKKWKIKNTGSCAWNRKFSLQFVSGDRMSGETTYLTKWVPPDKTTIVSVELIAPETEGTYTGYWILTDANGAAFGGYVYIKIVV